MSDPDGYEFGGTDEDFAGLGHGDLTRIKSVDFDYEVIEFGDGSDRVVVIHNGEAFLMCGSDPLPRNVKAKMSKLFEIYKKYFASHPAETSVNEANGKHEVSELPERPHGGDSHTDSKLGGNSQCYLCEIETSGNGIPHSHSARENVEVPRGRESEQTPASGASASNRAGHHFSADGDCDGIHGCGCSSVGSLRADSKSSDGKGARTVIKGTPEPAGDTAREREDLTVGEGGGRTANTQSGTGRGIEPDNQRVAQAAPKSEDPQPCEACEPYVRDYSMNSLPEYILRHHALLAIVTKERDEYISAFKNLRAKFIVSSAAHETLREETEDLRSRLERAEAVGNLVGDSMEQARRALERKEGEGQMPECEACETCQHYEAECVDACLNCHHAIFSRLQAEHANLISRFQLSTQAGQSEKDRLYVKLKRTEEQRDRFLLELGRFANRA